MDIVDQKNISSEEEVEFIKKVPLHPRERLSRKVKICNFRTSKTKRG